MKKFLLASAILASALSVASYASAKSDLLTTDRVGPADAPNTINADIMSTYTPLNSVPAAAKGIKGLYLNWAKHNPKWKMNLNAFVPTSAREVQLLEQLRAGTGPDCATIDSFQAPVYKKYLQPMEGYFTKDELKDIFPKFIQNASDANGHLKFLWFSTDVVVVYYNKDMMKITKKPTTWAEFEADLTKAHKAFPKKIGLYVSGSRYESTSVDWYGFYWQQGGKLTNDAGKPVFGDKTNRPKMIKALALYQRLAQNGVIPKLVTSVRNANDLIGHRKTIAWLGGSWMDGLHKKLLTSAGNQKYLDKIDFFTLPSYNGKDFAVPTGGWTFAIFTKNKAKAQACANIGKEIFRGQQHQFTGEMPTVFSAYKTPKFATKNLNIFKNIAAKYGQARQGVPMYPEISLEIQIMLSEILSGKKLDLGKTVDKSYSKMLRSYKRVSRHSH